MFLWLKIDFRPVYFERYYGTGIGGIDMALKLAIASALLYGFCWTQLFYAFDCVLWYSALIQGFVLGLLAGDLATGMILGGGITLLTISMVASG